MKTLVAVTQMTASSNKTHNLQHCEANIEKAARLGAQVICLPEDFAFFGEQDGDSLQAAEPLEGPTIEHYKKIARQFNTWLLLGGFQEKIPDNSKIYNTHVVLSAQGQIAAVYRKQHLFSVTLPDGMVYREADYVQAGNAPQCFDSPFFTGGLGICFDLRFGSHFRALRKLGAQVMFLPAAFTETTGRAHWEVLLRARAIETQSYVAASAQFGRHNPIRRTYGHAMIIDPWGHVLASCGDNMQVALAEIDLAYLQKIRQNMIIED